jgi:FtsH-binding integral membrane protein
MSNSTMSTSEREQAAYWLRIRRDYFRSQAARGGGTLVYAILITLCLTIYVTQSGSQPLAWVLIALFVLVAATGFTAKKALNVLLQFIEAGQELQRL